MPISAFGEQSAQTYPRLAIGAPQGRSGKTTVTLGLCAALAERGYVVQPFKKGPDYIDPSWLTEAAGQACRTLDPFFLPTESGLRQAFLKGASGADLSLVEGNHGLYDSMDDEGGSSTAAVARALSAPVILVVNAARMSRSVAALVRGYQLFEPETHIAAVILNNVAQSRHEAKLRRAIEQHCRLPVVGALPRDEGLTIPDRHLGLIPRAEGEVLAPVVEACRRAAELYLDLDAVLDLARTAPSVVDWPEVGVAGTAAPAANGPRVPIGVIRDRVFSFYYPENLEALVEAGAELVFIDALNDARLPPVAALYIGGGFPEIFMQELAANRSLRLNIRAAVEGGMPVYAECGGLMYLARRIVWGKSSAEMVGALPFDIEMTGQPQGHGYVLAETIADNPFLEIGAVLRGHEFHNSRLVGLKSDHATAYRLSRGRGVGEGRDGLLWKNILAGYMHLHAAGSPGWAKGLVARARAFLKD